MQKGGGEDLGAKDAQEHVEDARIWILSPIDEPEDPGGDDGLDDEPKDADDEECHEPRYQGFDVAQVLIGSLWDVAHALQRREYHGQERGDDDGHGIGGVGNGVEGEPSFPPRFHQFTADLLEPVVKVEGAGDEG